MRSMSAIILGLGLLAAAASASIPEIPDPEAGGISAHQLVGFSVCRITELREGRTIVVVDERDRREHVLTLGEDLKIRAREKKAFDGRRKLTFEDLDVGHLVKVKYLKSDGGLVAIDVLKDKTAK